MTCEHLHLQLPLYGRPGAGALPGLGVEHHCRQLLPSETSFWTCKKAAVTGRSFMMMMMTPCMQLPASACQAPWSF